MHYSIPLMKDAHKYFMIQFCISQVGIDTFLYNHSMENSFAEKNRIKELRLERGISQRELAKLTGIKQANISRWEAGLIVPNVNDIWTLADFIQSSSCLIILLEKTNFRLITASISNNQNNFINKKPTQTSGFLICD